MRMFADFRQLRKNSMRSENGNRRYIVHGALDVGMMYGKLFQLWITPTEPYYSQ